MANVSSPRWFSTLSIKRALATAGYWTQVKEFLVSNDAWDDFVLADKLYEADPMFAQFLPAIQKITGWSGDKVEEFLSQVVAQD